jgi:cytochrome c-type biogenesis protein CcmH
VSARNRQWAGWSLLVLVVLVALFVGLTDERPPATDADRAHRLKESIQCPVCNGQNVLESNAPISTQIRTQIDEMVADGRGDGEIRQFFADQYGEFVLLNPSGEGITALVWVLPVVVLLAGAAGLGLAFLRWRDRAGRSATEEDRELVRRSRNGA